MSGLGVLILLPCIVNDFLQGRVLQSFLSVWLAVGVLLLGFLMRLGKSVSELVLFVSVAPSTALLLMLCVQQQEMIFRCDT